MARATSKSGVFLRTASLCAIVAAIAQPADAQDDEQYTPAEDYTLDPEIERQLREERWGSRLEPEDLRLPSEEGENLPPTSDEPPQVRSLPGDAEASAATPQHISLPTAEGSVQGMGESFSPVLSAGTGTYSVPIAIPAGRAGVQPSLALSYSTSGGNSSVGFGWGLGVPFISRQTDRGLPLYDDRSRWHPQEDRFIYIGGQELVPVADADVLAFDDNLGPPSDLIGWQQYRARIEGGFMRFFRSPDYRRWVVEGPDGSRLELGEVPSNQLPSDFGSTSAALESEAVNGEGRIARWYLTKMSDAHGSTVYYRYREDEGNRYLRDIHYVSPHSCASGGDYVVQRNCTAPLINYGRRVRFEYESRQDVFDSYVNGWRTSTGLRLLRIAVSAAQGAPGSRAMVRRYHLSYANDSFHSLLASVQVEGRPHAMNSTAGVLVGNASVPESQMDGTPASFGPMLPPLTFGYSGVSRPTTPTQPGFGGFDGTVRNAPFSPPHSVDEARADFYDVNSDGLPDLIVTDPARYRTPSRQPAVGVFFNGFSGSGAAPASAGTFSDAVSVPMPPHLSNILDLDNSNVVPMDIDGDGRGDMLHMPRQANYGYFAITRNADANAVRPSQQGWQFAHIPVRLPSGDTDPRIDLTRDGAHIRVFDVNNDHLIDVVRTTGTVMQTWLNLGWLEGGEGRFGSYTIDSSSGQATLSTEPYESCLLYSGTPIDFEDPEVRLADMNGDGIQDIVQLRRGLLRYWPGRGLGLWGEGPPSCDRGQGANRYIEVASPPQELNVELAGVYLEDVNHDGASDVIQVRYNEMDVWLSRAGRSFTSRIIVRNTPYAPAYAPRIRILDVDGSGTVDVVFGNADRYQWVDLMGGLRPRLLTRVANGLGALTTLEYGSSAAEYLRDLAQASSCSTNDVGCDRFTWSGIRGACDPVLPGACLHRSGGSPVISTVVKAVSTTDQFQRVGREETVSRTEYSYHDGYYEGIEQEFRGFGTADATSVVGVHDSHPAATSRTFFHQGRRPNEIAVDRLADNPYEPIKGREYLTESWDATTNVRLSTAHSTYTNRLLLTGLDGRAIRYVYVSRTDELRYDVSLGYGNEGTTELPSVVFQEVTNPAQIPSDGASDPPHVVAQRGLGTIAIRSTIDEVDNRGHVLQSTAHGRPGIDQAIEQHASVLRIPQRWIWRQDITYVEATGEFYVQCNHTYTDRAYDANGDHMSTAATACNPPNESNHFDFPGDSNGAVGFSVFSYYLFRDTSTSYDAWGNATASCVGFDSTWWTIWCFRYGEVVYDTAYAQFPETERLATDRNGSTMSFLTTAGQWDRGLGVLNSVTDPNGEVTNVGYDGFGRVTYVRAPVAGHSGSGACSSNTVPNQRFVYDLAVNGLPVSVVRSYSENDCSAIGADTIETRSYVDGLGRPRASLSPGDSGAWIQSGVSILNARGTVRRAFQNEWVTESEPTVQRALRIPGSGYERFAYDAFDRPRCVTSACGNMTCTTYHALTTDVCDPLDMSTHEIHGGTCTTTRSDGHGRVVDQILRNRQEPYGPIEYYRLWTDYRADNSVTKLTRAQTTTDGLRGVAPVISGHQVERIFTYDSQGRRLASTDPDSDSTNPARNSRNRTWRYAYNGADDLMMVRDPRQCGQNFFYDRVGRLIGEDYVECAEIQRAAEIVSETVPATAWLNWEGSGPRPVDVRYYYDAPPSWASAYPQVIASEYAGRLAAVSDRGQRSAMAYDARGQVTWAVRQMVVIGEEPALTITNANPGHALPPVTSEGAVPIDDRIYDEDHDYVRTSRYDYGGRPTSMELPIDPDWELLGGTGAAPVIGGTLEYDGRGLPTRVSMTVDGTPRTIVDSIVYNQHGLVTEVTYGDDNVPGGGSRDPTVTVNAYDACLRPTVFHTTRQATSYGGSEPRPLSLVTTPMHQVLTWDSANNLVAIADERIPEEWPDGYRPQSVDIEHDALYRVIDAEYTYHKDNSATGTDLGRDWRDDQAPTQPYDPMRTAPAPMVPNLPSERVNSLTWQYDWLGNMQDWTDDASSFYERSLGDIENGADRVTHLRPSALHLASNIRDIGGSNDPLVDRGGWVDLSYGENGNVVAMTVHGQCRDLNASTSCWDDHSAQGSARLAHLRASCTCASEQHYDYRWDELNRLHEARRYDRSGGSAGSWTLAVRQRYRYDSANQRTIKQTLAASGSDPERIALYVYPGDYERRGLVRATLGDAYDASTGLDTETQYLAGGARIVWKHEGAISGLERDQRIAVPLSDLIHTTAAVLDLNSGELLESSTYYPNGAREDYRTQDVDGIAAEPDGFTEKEGDEEIGLVYFGERYLISRLGRWATPDPLHIHAVSGGEALNGYHYVSGNLLQAKDPLGLDAGDEEEDSDNRIDEGPRAPTQPPSEMTSSVFIPVQAPQGLNPSHEWALVSSWDSTAERAHVGLYFRPEDGAPHLEEDYGRERVHRMAGGWVQYDPCFDNDCSSARPDEVGNFIIETVGTAGISLTWRIGSAVAGRAVVGAVGALERAAILRMCPGGVCPCFVAGTPVRTDDGHIPIELVAVGDRVLPYDDTCTNHSVAAWTEFQLVIQSPADGDVFSITLLREADWLSNSLRRSDGAVFIFLDELNVQGWAQVVTVRPHVPRHGTTGCLVTGTINHYSTDFVSIVFDHDRAEPLVTTPGHPLYSATRAEWVHAGDLEPHERLVTASVDAVATSIVRETRTRQIVYNLEIAGSHRYYVHTIDVLAHNTCGAAGAVGVARAVTPSSRALGRALEAAGHTRPSGSAAHHIVAGTAPGAARARAVLRGFGIRINDEVNGVFLPASRASPNPTGAAVHSTLHTGAYYHRVNQMLAAATTRAEAEAVLAAIRRSLLSGGL